MLVHQRVCNCSFLFAAHNVVHNGVHHIHEKFTHWNTFLNPEYPYELAWPHSMSWLKDDPNLVGGLEHSLFFHIIIGNTDPN